MNFLENHSSTNTGSSGKRVKSIAHHFSKTVEKLKRLNITNWVAPAITQRCTHQRHFNAAHRPKQKNHPATNTVRSFQAVWGGGDI